MSFSAMNILLELDDSNELIFSIVSNVELRTEILINKRKILNVKPKPEFTNGKDFSFKIFYTPETLENLDKIPEMMFVKSEELEELNWHEEVIPAYEVTTASESVPVIRPETNENQATSLISNNPDAPQIYQVVEEKPYKYLKRYKFQCEKCKKKFERQASLDQHVNNKKCFIRMPFGNRKTVIRTLAYLPPGLQLPDLNKINNFPYTDKIIQPDNTISYIHQASRFKFLWIANFDIFGSDNCDICGEKYTNYTCKLIHRRREHFFPGNKKNCNICHKQCETLNDKKYHVLYCPKADQIIPFFCYDCNFLFNDPTSFRVHLFQHHQEKNEVTERPHVCVVCNQSFQHKYRLLAHKRLVHNKDKRPYYYCSHCFYKTKYRVTIQRHLIRKHFPSLAPAKCNLCSPVRLFDFKSEYMRHVIFTHGGSKQITQNVEPTNETIHRPTIYEYHDTEIISLQRVEIKQEEMEEPDDEVNDVIIVPQKPVEKLLILDSDTEDEKEDILVRYIIEKEHDYTTTYSDPDFYQVDISIDKSHNSQSETISKQLDTNTDKNDENISKNRIPSGYRGGVLLKPNLSKNVTKLKQKDEEYPKDTKRSKFDYLPKGLVLPNLKKIKQPIRMEAPQPDGTTAFIYQKARHTKIFISNFDLTTKICEICDATYKTIGGLLKHRMRYHLFHINNTCVACKMTFDSPDLKYRHTMYCLEQNNFKRNFCYACEIQFESFYSMVEHVYINHPQNEAPPPPKESEQIKCSICEKMININNKWRHMKTHKIQTYECAHCDKKCQIKETMLNHLSKIHFSHLTKHACKKCDPPRYYNTTEKYVQHIRTHKKDKIDPFTVEIEEKVKCPQCTKFVAKTNLNEHLAIVHKARENNFAVRPSFTCDVCGKIFLERSSLNSHKECHLPDSEKRYKCQFCSKGFTQRNGWIEHERIHTGEKPYVCPHCSKAFAKRQTFRDHVNTHTGNGYKCDHCERTLWDHSSYRKHLKTHERELGVKLTYNKEERRWADMGLLDNVKDLL